jgi:hypothetical protein
MTRADEIRKELYRMECAYDNLFTDRDLMAEYDALNKELRNLPAAPYNKLQSDVAMTLKSVRAEIKAIRFARDNGYDPASRIGELCRVWPYYRAARRALLAG